MSKSLDRRRAEQALKNIMSIEAGSVADAYKSYVKGVPAQLVTLGLGQTLAVLLARGANDSDAGQGGQAPTAYQLIFNHLSGWLLIENPLALELGDTEKRGSAARMALITAMPQRDYMILQAEAFAYLEWLKKFANAFLLSVDDPALDREAS